MSKGPRKIRGTQDMLGEEAERFHRVVRAFDRVRRLHCFRHVEVPIFEATEIFARSLGETTDVVSKEMYTFEDRGGDSLTLRPEFTAGICRAYVSEGWQQHAPLKIAAWGPAFRYERPQKGRFRQFHQVDAEIIGAAEPAADVEIIVMAAHLMDELGLGERVELRLNTLGDPATREAWRSALIDYFRGHQGRLSDESRARLERNPLRILDSKDSGDQALVADAPGIDAFLTPEARDFFGAVTDGLDRAGIAWTREPRLVRGLDYYRHTTFEFVTAFLGAQSQVIGGGRYDGLIEAMGGPATPAVGWAGGIERLAMLIDRPDPEAPDAVLVPIGERAEAEAVRIAAELRRAGIACDMTWKGNMKRRMQKASASGARFAILIGDDELDRGEASVKDLASGEQQSLALSRLAGALRAS